MKNTGKLSDLETEIKTINVIVKQDSIANIKLYLLRTKNESHDTFIKAFSNISTFNRDSSLKTWAFKIATNLTYDHLRKLKRWHADAQDRGADLAIGSEEVRQAFWNVMTTRMPGLTK